MDPFVGGMLGSALIGGAFSAYGQRRANQQSQASADKEMAFQERMSSTAWQRSVQDMQKAGLNPLYYLKGGAASTPGGAMGQFGNEFAGAQDSASNYSARKLQKEIQDAQVMNLKAQNEKLVSEALETRASTAKILAETKILPHKEKTEKFLGELGETSSKTVKDAKGYAEKIGGSIGHFLHDIFGKPNVDFSKPRPRIEFKNLDR